MFGRPCVFVRAAALVNMLCPPCMCVCTRSSMCGLWSEEMGFFIFSLHFTSYRAVFLSFSHSDCLPPTRLALVVLTTLYPPQSSSRFFSLHLFVRLHPCLHFSLIVLPFSRPLPLLLWFGVYFVPTSVTATFATTLIRYFPTAGHLDAAGVDAAGVDARCARRGQAALMPGKTFITDCIANKQ